MHCSDLQVSGKVLVHPHTAKKKTSGTNGIFVLLCTHRAQWSSAQYNKPALQDTSLLSAIFQVYCLKWPSDQLV